MKRYCQATRKRSIHSLVMSNQNKSWSEMNAAQKQDFMRLYLERCEVHATARKAAAKRKK